MKEFLPTWEEFRNLEILHARYSRGLNEKYYMTMKQIMEREHERRKMGGNKIIHNAINNSQQG